MDVQWGFKFSPIIQTTCLPERLLFSGIREKLQKQYNRHFLGNGVLSKFSSRSRITISTAPAKSQVDRDFTNSMQLLSPAKEVAEDEFSAEDLHPLKAIYKILLTTCPEVGSELSDINAGVLVCMIGENGSSFLHRIPSIPFEHGDQKFDRVRFQRGSTDTVTLYGPDIGRLATLLIGPESGSWRLAGLSVLKIQPRHCMSDKVDYQEQQREQFVSLSYSFMVDEVLLGDGGISAAELRPSKEDELYGKESWTEFQKFSGFALKKSITEDTVRLREESLEEYKNLKTAMLLYSALFVGFGTSVSAILGRFEISRGFSIGGLIGFLYLLLLQRKVDKIPASPSLMNFPSPDSDSNMPSSVKDKTTRASNTLTDQNIQSEPSMLSVDRQPTGLLSGYRGPLTGFSLVIFLMFVASRYGSENFMISLRPQELLAGAAGFLTCKAATIIAAFKTIDRE